MGHRIAPRRREVELPVILNGDLALPGNQIMTRGNFLDMAKNCVRRKRGPISKDLVQNPQIDLRTDLVLREKGFDSRAKNEALFRDRVEERADPEAVACEKKRLFPGVPDRESELAVEPLQASRPKLFVSVQQNLRVRFRGEPVAKRLQLGAQLDVIEKLPIKDDA